MAEDSRMCTACRVKFAQHAGLCRTCGREAGIYTKTTAEAEGERVDRQHAELDALRVERAQPARTARVVQGEEFVTVWSGVGPLPGAGDAAGLGSTLSGNGFSVGKRV